MSQKHIVQANIFNNILLQYDKFKSSIDYFFALQEFSLGQPSQDRIGNVLDLCWGYAYINPTSLNQSSLAQPQANFQYKQEAIVLASNEIVIGQGITRTTNQYVTKRLNDVQTFFTGLNPSNILSVSYPYKLRNVYAFGSIYLKPSTPSQLSINPSPTLEFSLLRGELGAQSTPLFIYKDISLNEVTDMIYNDIIKAAEKPTALSVELARVIIDIDYYDPNDNTKKFIKFYYIDTRKPRGWGGYAEEILAKNLVPNIIVTYDESLEFDNIFLQNIDKLIMSWVNLSSWDNSSNFIDFWRLPENFVLLPQRLKSYLQDRSLI